MKNDIAHPEEQKQPVIAVSGVSKAYFLYQSARQRLREALNPFSQKQTEPFWALRDVTFQIFEGEPVAILGRNGSGKSTLLQLICGIGKPTSGIIQTRGRISALLELGAGFNPEYTGRSNVYLSWAMQGYRKHDVDARIDEIAKFADIGDFFDQPVKTYSSGMFTRLAFSSAIHIEPDILLIDEALSVGDIFFQQKCFRKIREIISRGAACLFVSHDTRAVSNLCFRALLLDGGRLEYDGSSETAINLYFTKIGKRPAPRRISSSTDEENTHSLDVFLPVQDLIRRDLLQSLPLERHGAGGLTIEALVVTDPRGRDTLRVAVCQELFFHLLIKATERIENPRCGIHLNDRFGNLVFAAGTVQLRTDLPPMCPGDSLQVTFRLRLSVVPGQYTFTAGTSEPTPAGPRTAFFRDRIHNLGPITVEEDEDQIPAFYGIAQLPMQAFFRKLPDSRTVDRGGELV